MTWGLRGIIMGSDARYWLCLSSAVKVTDIDQIRYWFIKS